jgi:hypothetical protein
MKLTIRVTSRGDILTRKYNNDGNNYFLFVSNYMKLLPMNYDKLPTKSIKYY